MNGTFQLIRRARSEGLRLRPPQSCEVAGTIACVRGAPPGPAGISEIEEPFHTGSIYRELMRKYDRVNTRHLR